MATQWYEYDDDAGTKYGISLTDAQQALYAAVIGVLPTAYASLAALQVAIPAALAFPNGLASRYFNVTSDFFGSAQLVTLNTAQFDAKYPTGVTPFPATPISVTENVAITGAVGESRLNN
jgi:hypothetical protein